MGAVAVKEEPKRYRKPSYRRRVERLLSQYPILKAAIEIEQHYEEMGAGYYPSCTSSYEERMSGGKSEYQSTTEKYGIQRAYKHLQIERIDRALMSLKLDERLLIEKRYLEEIKTTDINVYTQFGWSERQYYRIKDQAMLKLAMVLNLM